jgi:hypothetical protein
MPNTPETNQNIESAPFQTVEPSKIEIRDRITRDDVRAETDKIFLFGDNLTERGFGGQAAEMRGEENAVGIPTKKAPSNNPNSFFTDKEFAANKQAIDEAFGKIPIDKTVVIPKAGLGTGLAQLEEKAPRTFAYLNEKLAEIGFSNPNKESVKTISSKSSGENKVVIQNAIGESGAAKRLLDLNNIQTASLKVLSPTEKEIDALKIDSEKALADYADRLRLDYKTNKDNFRDGLKLLSDSLENGEQITIACSCRNGAMCHADVVKMAVEKVNAHIKNGQISEKNRNEIAESRSSGQVNSAKQQQIVNPRTQRSVNEIFSFSENDRILEKINDTDGRNRSEQASHLAKSSQFVRDIYERGANVVDGNLIVPQEKLTVSPPLSITTHDYAVSRIGKILQDEERAKELAPVVVEYANKIAGLTADGETKLKVFGWIYDSLEGKNENLQRGENDTFADKSKFDETLREISDLAEEMHSLESLDKIEFVPLAGNEQADGRESVFDEKSENLNLEEIYEEAISRQEAETTEKAQNLESGGKINTEGYERIELGVEVPRIPGDFTQTENNKLITETLPEIDRRIENGTSPKEILATYNEAVWQSAREDALNRLESIYRKQKINGNEPQQSGAKTIDLNENLHQQLAKIDLRRQNVIELKSPGEFLSAEKEAVKTFYRSQKIEVGSLLTRIDEIREQKSTRDDKTQEISLKKELDQIKEAKPNFAFKLENSAEIVVGKTSEQSVQTRNFISSYINYQLKQPETRLRFENERYRTYAAKLESAATREDVMKSASEIRAENAVLGLRWKDLDGGEKAKMPRPLTSKEMQFLFTESSPVHYTGEMTTARLSYAHTGASRRAMTESLLKGEIKPSPEADKLIESLESRLQRREIKDSLLATKHFFESVKTSNELLKYKNSFDHREIYQKLPPQEKDFVYARATQQKENLEYQLVFKKQQLNKGEEINHIEQTKPQLSQAEKSFHLRSQFNQARILGANIEATQIAQKEISEHDIKAIAVLLKNQPIEKLENLSQEFQKSEKTEHKKIGEIVQTFASAEISESENKTIVSIILPENKLVGVETYSELLEKFYPDDARENEKYKFERFGEKEVSRALQKGQDETINNFRDEIKGNVYQKDAPAKESGTETAITEKLDKIARFQAEARNALSENKSILGKYVARTNSKMQNQKTELPSPSNKKEIVKFALGGKSSNLVSNKVHDQFLQAVQKEITISDFQKFKANEKFLDETKFGIKNEFAEISRDMKVLEETKLKTEPERDQHLDQTYGQFQQQEEKVASIENKPLSLQIYEKEIEKAEKQLLAENLNEKLSGKDKEIQNAETLFSAKEREEIKIKAAEVAKEKLEPKELDADHRKVSSEADKQALTTFKQLERAANVFQFSNDSNKIREAFAKLDTEAATLNKIRQDYGKAEKIALLREGIKADIIDLFSKNSDRKTGNFSELTKEIVGKNFYKAGFVGIAGDSERIVKISREIGEKLEAKQLFAGKEKQNFFFSESKDTKISGKILEAAAEKLKPKFEQAKESFVRSR